MSPLLCVEVRVAVQLSEAVGAVQLTAAEQLPASAVCVMSAGTPLMTGVSLSWTVTVKVAVVVLPLTSVAVKTRVLVPRSEQSKFSWLMASEAIPQASDEPLSMSAAVAVAAPAASSCSVRFWANAVGATLSSTVTDAVALAELPDSSVTVRVTVTGAPTSVQSKDVSSSVMLARLLQSSYDPLSTSAVVMVAAPDASNWTVRSCAMATGGTASRTVMMASAEALFPLVSVTVMVTVLLPTWLQSKAV